MVLIRCTQKLLRRLPPARTVTGTSTTKLGDWYANLLGVGQQRFILLVSGHCRLPVLLRARDVKHLSRHLPPVLADVLEGLGVPSRAIEIELSEMQLAVIAPTNNRSVLGTLNDFSNAAWFRLQDEPSADLIAVALWLSETPMHPFGGKAPDQLTRALLV